MNFRDDALREMADITAQGKIPLLVGGTMLYYKALIEGLSPLPSADENIRAELEQKQLNKVGQHCIQNSPKSIPCLPPELIRVILNESIVL